MMGRYNSTDPNVDTDIGLYRVFEKYNAPLRSWELTT